MTPPRVACIGEAMIELALDDNVAQVGVAGDTLNTAVYLHRAAPSLTVDFITCLGDETFSERIQSFISDQGIGTKGIMRIPGAVPGLYAITTNADGERSFTYWRTTSAARQMFNDHDFSVLAEYDALYLSGISLAILPRDVRLALIDWLQRQSVRVIFDSNYRPRLWENASAARVAVAALWDRADIALPSLDDEMALFDEDVGAVLARFARYGTTGALKRAALGPFSLGTPVNQDYPAAANVIDTTAAGDSFNGGYLGAVLTGSTQAGALMAGHILAARVVGYRGAILPT